MAATVRLPEMSRRDTVRDSRAPVLHDPRTTKRDSADPYALLLLVTRSGDPNNGVDRRAFARRCAHAVENPNAETATADVRAAVRDSARRDRSRAQHRRRRVEGTHPMHARTTSPAAARAARDLRGDGSGRARARQNLGAASRARAAAAARADRRRAPHVARRAAADPRRGPSGAHAAARAVRSASGHEAAHDAVARVRWADEHPRALPHRGAHRAAARGATTAARTRRDACGGRACAR